MSHAGRFVWRECMSTDPAATRAFYSQLFGWSFNEMDMGELGPYVMFHNDAIDEDTGGLMAAQGGAPSHWLDYITVDDVDASLARVEALGGCRFTDAMDIPGMGRFAIVADPTGAAFGLFQSLTPGVTDTERRPPDHTFCWSQLNTRELDRVVSFYGEIFGWTAEPMGPGMVVFKRGAAMVASAMAMPAESGDAPSHWLQYVAVEDCDAAFARATELGATTRMAPTDMPGMGRFAVLADPAGATVALWRDASR